jgi:muramoyltetrapeptide carboxypeptidase LdcA involved in peptidoglycan recycling
MAGIFDAVAGVVVGDFIDCDEIEDDQVKPPATQDVLVERLGWLAVPVALNGGFGHGDRKASLPYGARVELDTDTGQLAAVEGAVS